MYRGDCMKIKKVISTALTLTIVTSACYYAAPVAADEFDGNESKYMTLCSSSNLSSSNKSTCEAFNKYLKTKNSELTKKLAEQKEAASDTKTTLESVQKQLDEVNKQISDKEAEIEYLNTTIANLQASIEKNTQLLKDRMYAMQSYANENTYINFIFGASNFTEMFSRIDGYNELTQSDKELIEELNKQRKEVEQQQTILEEAKATLVIQQEEQKTLKTLMKKHMKLQLLHHRLQNLIMVETIIIPVVTTTIITTTIITIAILEITTMAETIIMILAHQIILVKKSMLLLMLN